MKDYVRKHFASLKDLFVSLASESQFPNITGLDFAQFVQKCQILDDNLRMDRLDRLFIATNYEMDE